jgi:addiction module RelB/DinJ family antitoxin
MNTTIQIRIDQATKTKAQKAFKGMGLDLSSGIKYLLTQAGKADSLSYICDFGYMHNYNSKKAKEMHKEIEYAKKHAKRFSSVQEMFVDLEK